MQPKGGSNSEHAKHPAQQDRGIPEEFCPKHTSMKYTSKETDEPPNYSLRPAESRGLHAEQQPDSTEEQDDRPWVDPECMDLDSLDNVEVTHIDNVVVPEDDLDDDDEETSLVGRLSPENPESIDKKKSEFLHCSWTDPKCISLHFSFLHQVCL